MIRIGNGYDVHRLVKGRKLILGGVDIPHETGLLGHSDADVLIHAIMDSLLGALALGDIGCMFPDTDIGYKDADSVELLKEVFKHICVMGYEIGNIDTVIAAQNPKLMPYADAMRRNIANALNTDIGNISVKATTEEGLGFTGDGTAIKAYASCILKRSEL